MPAARRLGLGLLPYFPLASGLLSGKYRRNVALPAGTRLALEHQPKKRSPLSFVPIFVLGGAYERAGDADSAFGGSRATRYVVNISAATPTDEGFDAERSWVRDYWAALVPHAKGVGSYVNFMTEYEEDRVRAAYGPQKYARLAEIKTQYDPDNVLHLNANIVPSSTS